MFLADRRAAAAGRRAPALGDICPEIGRGRLSYPRAEYLFKQTSKLHDPHGAGYTLHQLRHSGLTHLAAKGRSAAELQAKSRHRHLATLGIYVRFGEEISARITAENDEHHADTGVDLPSHVPGSRKTAETSAGERQLEELGPPGEGLNQLLTVAFGLETTGGPVAGLFLCRVGWDDVEPWLRR
ncbi:hypothetical protein [Micromonospora sp. KLBMP9576]|uniref:hypothetical protein n=1 Tax=Micromonospora sp. KLBMP9576 TaxID=3424769 RepID=UPI003D8B27E7